MKLAQALYRLHELVRDDTEYTTACQLVQVEFELTTAQLAAVCARYKEAV